MLLEYFGFVDRDISSLHPTEGVIVSRDEKTAWLRPGPAITEKLDKLSAEVLSTHFIELDLDGETIEGVSWASPWEYSQWAATQKPIKP